jgi:rsbT co-antagonist protein RsbR
LWLSNLPYTDPLEQRQASVLQGLLLTLIVAGVLDIAEIVLSPAPLQNRLILSSVVVLFVFGLLFVLRRLRRGSLAGAARATVGVLLIASILALGVTGLRGQEIVLLVYVLPIVLAGFLLERGGLLVTAFLSLLSTIGIAILEAQGVSWIGLAPFPHTYLSVVLLLTFIIGLLCAFLDRFGTALRETLATARAREQELERLRLTLEATVEERTAALQTALTEVEARAAEQARLLTENEQQRTIVRDLSVPIIPISTATLVMPLVGALDSERLEQLQGVALEAVAQSRVHTLVLDITGVPIVDSQVAQGLFQVVRAARLLGTIVMLVGVRPEVAQTMVELGLDFQGMHTFRDLQAALDHSHHH